jgi:signal transduction histidine kinase
MAILKVAYRSQWLKQFHGFGCALKFKSIISLAILFPSTSLAQEKNVSHLKEELQSHTREDSTRVNLLNTLASEILNTDYDQAKAYARQANDLAVKIDFKKGMAKSYETLGLLEDLQGNRKVGIEAMMKALAIYQSIGDKAGVGYTLSLLGSTYVEHDTSYQKGMNLLFESLKIAEEIKDNEVLSEVTNAIGLTYASHGEFENGLKYLEKNLILSKKDSAQDGGSGIARDLCNIAGCLQELGRIEEAIPKFIESLARAEQLNHRRLIAIISHRLAMIFLSKEDLSKAYEYVSKNISIGLELKDQYILGYGYLIRGEIYFKWKKTILALTDLNRALQISRDNRDRLLERDAERDLFLIYKEQGNYSQALYHHEQFKILNDSALSNKRKEVIATLDAQYQSAIKDNKLKTLEAEARVQAASLNRQKVISWIIAASSIGLLSMLAVIFYLRSQYRKKLHLVEMGNFLSLEKERISHDLHDNIGTKLTTLSQGLNRLAKSDMTESGKIQSLYEDTNAAITELRDTIWGINKSNVKVQELIDKINNFFWRLRLQYEDIRFEVNANDILPDRILHPTEAINVFRIVQEAVNNAIKHARATQIDINFSMNEKTLWLQVIDNGVGFDITKGDIQEHYGLTNMKKRAKDLRGKLEVDTQLKEGTRIDLTMPLAFV